jgi:trigger factor
MEHSVKLLENSKAEITLVFNQDEWKKAQSNAFKKLSADIKIDGFRPGKAPEHLLKGRINTSKLYDTAINALLPDAYSLAIKEHKLTPLSRPNIDVTKVSDTELELKATLS